MTEIGFLDVGPHRDEQHDPARGRQRFSVPEKSLDAPDFQVADMSDHDDQRDATQGDGTGGRQQRRAREQEKVRHEECYACPIGVAYGTMRGVRPETTDRLANAIADLVEAAAGAIDMLSSEGKRTRDRLRRVDIE